MTDSPVQMWLINVFTFHLREFTSSTPPYTTFSYVTYHKETSFEDLAHTEKGTSKEGLGIIQRACTEARNTGSEWLWNFAACVDKRSCAAQSEAINSLAQIYRDCGYSIIYLEDLDFELAGDESIGERLVECRWTKSIWAIPQIIFPREAYFYSSDWSRIGSKKSLLPHLSSIIGIDRPVLDDSDCLEDYSIARRMSWATEKTALRIEDYAYALLGLFYVSMPIIYGEGQKAFVKLQEEIMRDTDDFSLLAWDTLDAQDYTGLFARSPTCFHRFRSGPMTPLSIKGETHAHCAGITIETSLWKVQGSLFLPLEGRDGSNCCIPLLRWDGHFVRKGGQVEWDLSNPMSLEPRKVCIKRDVTARLSRKVGASGEVVQVGPPRYFEPSGIGPTGGSRTSNGAIDYNYRIDSMAIPVEECGMTSQCATSASFGEVASQEDPTVWSAQGACSMRGSLSAPKSDMRRPSGSAGVSEAEILSEDCIIDDAEGNSLHRDFTCATVQSGPYDVMHLNGSPPTENQVLNVAQISKELADIAKEQFLTSCQIRPAKRYLIPWLGQTRKRPKLTKPTDHLEAFHTSEFDDGETVVVKKTKFFACPFYIWDKKYTKCITRHHLLSIEDVKDHVLWDHRQPVFCPLCKQEFPSSRNRDIHIRLRNCHLNTAKTPAGITYDQDDMLNREERSSLSEESRWFQVWDIIFPQLEHPPSAFYTGERELSICAFRQFWMQRGEEIIAAFLQNKGCRRYSIQNEERELQAIFDLVAENVVDRIFFDSATAREMLSSENNLR